MNDASDTAPLDPSTTESWLPAELDDWRSGWLGIAAYGHVTHGFATMTVGAVDDPVAQVYWLAPDFDVHETFRLRFDPTGRCVDLLVGLDEWSCEESISLTDDQSADFSALCTRSEVFPDELFTRMAALQYADFEISIVRCVDAQDLSWDHGAIQGPGPGIVWCPVDLR
ncbi:hypothetical protein [Amycolatopsis echigonensis]|uniref:Uncharacterized protein n=1 Tax=Amycolatopsis echigonensis TaxID=2576905 RepID=A0A8E1VUW0_9PSEU|nr:hypothetical protein [Amycolatopsis echigonensis]MBB2498757.1 hypothetical protein [Amycolatopsis echigonensis]